MKSRNICASLILALLSMSNAANAQTGSFIVLKKFPISGDGKWDYLAVSPVKDYLYVSHGSQVNVINKKTGDSVGVITNTPGVHGIAFAQKYNTGYTSNGKANSVTVFDINTNTIIAQIPTGENPDAIMYDEFSKMVVVCNGHSKDLSFIDPATNKVVKTLALAGKPETAVSDEAGKLFVNIEDKNEIAVINTKTFTVENRWHTGKGEEPSGLAIDIKTQRLFAGCGNKLLVVMNAGNGKVVKEMPIGDGSDGVAFDAQLKQIYSSNGTGTMTIIKEKSANDYQLLAELPTMRGAKTIALDQATHLLYLPTAEFEKTEGAKKPGSVPGTFRVLVVGAGH